MHRQRGNSADVSTQRGPSVNLRTASHKPKKRLTKKMAYKKPSSSEALKQPRENHNLAEKRYRSRLKNHFVSLEEGFEAMAKERDQLLRNIALMYEFSNQE
ncbi:uncharacterized protein BKA55DRAFT_584044 [Fusarium redolens]|uniref:BZIP domain-containing protein n=1 Tax=Fusarium redolens TaxID=48865 RepID=A0A9P9JLQ5_FUSRE|nr:uncharacterized protein BKA55DRAFT_584044 [Fusarium redolens]KAH7227066.1 hypothetical protein BKA55DRAFT_584044 [Fusarium redolens]